MSFILDALKKSENERQGQRGLGVADVPVARETPGAPPWIWWLLGLLAVNLLVLAAVLLRPGPEPVVGVADVTDSGPTVVPLEARPASVPERVAPELAALVDRTRTERSRAAPAGPSDDVADESPASEAAQVASATRAAAVPTAGPTPAAVETPDDDLPAMPAAGTTAGSGEEQALALPTLDELRVRGDTALPDLHLDIHVWSEEPRGRFVYVNTMKYRQGDTLTEGPRVASIIRNGVVLEHDGRRFLLPRE